jgi:ABC-type maltose transport system permease subunit
VIEVARHPVARGVIAGLNTDAGPLYGEMSAGPVMVMLPNIAMTLVLQGCLVKGLSLGAVKGEAPDRRQRPARACS